MAWRGRKQNSGSLSLAECLGSSLVLHCFGCYWLGLVEGLLPTGRVSDSLKSLHKVMLS